MRTIISSQAVFYFLFLLFVMILGCSPRLEDRLKAYEDAHNSHDVEKVMVFYAEDFRFEMVGSWVAEGKEEMRKLEEWDAAVNSHLTFTDLKVSGDTVTCKATERNDLYRIAGIEGMHYKSSIFIFYDGLIKEIKAEQTEKSVRAKEVVFKSFIEWASKERSQELTELKYEGEYVFSAENAKRWLALLQEWRKETVQP